ncbi:twin transmembrane helix small protein [Niveibacterium sp. SC-1]|uniref:twin transmembrane helix small protein n=1 Tax=Niveibacterium sp. SC-1 TaxID=3135646 RepID=UPI00311D7F87
MSPALHCALDNLERLMRVVVILIVLLILASLGSALVFLFKDRGRSSPRMVKALSMRVGLSIFLFLLLMAGYATGFLTQHL